MISRLVRPSAVNGYVRRMRRIGWWNRMRDSYECSDSSAAESRTVGDPPRESSVDQSGVPDRFVTLGHVTAGIGHAAPQQLRGEGGLPSESGLGYRTKRMSISVRIVHVRRHLKPARRVGDPRLSRQSRDRARSMRRDFIGEGSIPAVRAGVRRGGCVWPRTLGRLCRGRARSEADASPL